MAEWLWIFYPLWRCPARGDDKYIRRMRCVSVPDIMKCSLPACPFDGSVAGTAGVLLRLRHECKKIETTGRSIRYPMVKASYQLRVHNESKAPKTTSSHRCIIHRLRPLVTWWEGICHCPKPYRLPRTPKIGRASQWVNDGSKNDFSRGTKIRGEQRSRLWA